MFSIVISNLNLIFPNSQIHKIKKLLINYKKGPFFNQCCPIFILIDPSDLQYKTGYRSLTLTLLYTLA